MLLLNMVELVKPYLHQMLHCIVFYAAGQRSVDLRRLALRLEALSTQVQKLSRENDGIQLTRNDLSLLLHRYSTICVSLNMLAL